jgi:predicted tellurium resistance membrane protein TerC
LHLLLARALYVFVALLLGRCLAPFIVYTSNIFAILGLRAMYFLLLQAR